MLIYKIILYGLLAPPFALPLVASLIGWLMVDMTIRFSRRLNRWLIIHIQKELLAGLEELDPTSLFPALIDQHMNAIVARFKAQMPMLGSFLTEGISSALKEMSKEEIIEAWPTIQSQVAENLLEKIRLKQNLLDPQLLLCLKAFGALIGLCLGIYLSI